MGQRPSLPSPTKVRTSTCNNAPYQRGELPAHSWATTVDNVRPRTVPYRSSKGIPCASSPRYRESLQQVPGVTELLHLAVVVHPGPDHEQPAFVPVHSDIGGRSSQLNLSWSPAWCCHAMAMLGHALRAASVHWLRVRALPKKWRALWQCFARHCR